MFGGVVWLVGDFIRVGKIMFGWCKLRLVGVRVPSGRRGSTVMLEREYCLVGDRE